MGRDFLFSKTLWFQAKKVRHCKRNLSVKNAMLFALKSALFITK